MAVTVPSGGAAAGPHFSRWPELSSTGRYVCFMTDVPELIGADLNGIRQIVVLDRKLETTHLVTETKRGEPTTEYPGFPAWLSQDGRYVVFFTDATNLVDGIDVIDDNAGYDVFRHDVETGVTIRVSQTHESKLADHACYLPDVSAEGRFDARSHHHAHSVRRPLTSRFSARCSGLSAA